MNLNYKPIDIKRLFLGVKDSIALQLLSAVFSFYLLVAISITSFQFYIEWSGTKERIKKDLEVIQYTFQESLAQSTWNGDRKQLDSIIHGIQNNKIVVGVRLNSDIFGKVETGDIPNESDRIFHTFKIEYNNHGVKDTLGSIELFSHQNIVFDQVKTSLFFILISAVLKTAALWLIVYLVSIPLLRKPLKDLANVAKNIDLGKIEDARLVVNTENRNELTYLQISFNSMIDKLAEAKNQLYLANMSLENQVRDRTAKLEGSYLKIREQNDKLKAINKQMNEFVAIVSHDLRAPVGSVLSVLDAAESEPELLAELLPTLKNSTLMAFNLIEDLLDLTALTTGKIKLNIVPFCLADLIQECISGVMHLANKKKIELKPLLVDSPMVLGDVLRIRQVINNLIVNAIKFSHPGGTILIQEATFENIVRVQVTDSGVGIPNDVLPKLFRKDSKVSTFGTNGERGTGFGLPLSQELIISHGSEIKVNSQLEKGSTFSFDLPISQAVRKAA